MLSLTQGSINDITKTVVDLRERIEVLHTSEYNDFLQRLYPVLHSIITSKTKPQFFDNEENKCRHAILDLLYRFPHNEVLKPVVDNFLNMIMPIFAEDNEENALTALRIIFDLHKAYRPILESHAQPFLEQVQKILKNMPSAVKILFTATKSQPTSGQSHSKMSSASVHTSAQSMPGAIAVPMAPSSSSLGSQYSTPAMGNKNSGGNGSFSNVVEHNASVSTQASSALLLSSNTYLLGGTPAGAGVTSPVPMGVNMGVPESNDDNKLIRSGITVDASRPQLDSGPQLLLSQPNFSQSMQLSGSSASTAASPHGSAQMVRSMSSSPFQGNGVGDSMGSDSNVAATTSQMHHRPAFSSLTRSIDSFRVLAECPLIVMLLFQLYPKFQKYIPGFVPLMMNTLALAPSQVISAHRSKHKELVAAQVKTLSLLTYLLRNFENRQFAEATRPNEDAIARSVVALLRNCPADIVSTRKEILVAIRHILNTNDFKKGFYSYADLLLDEKLLLGPGKASNSVLRPMAYSTIADLVNHIKDSLTLPQLTKIVFHFSQNFHDPELTLPVQTTCVRVLFNLGDRLSFNFKENNTELPSGRTLLLHVIRVVINKFGAMRRFISRLDSQLCQTHNDGDQAEMGASDVFIDLLSQFHTVVAQKKAALQGDSKDVARGVGNDATKDVPESTDGRPMEIIRSASIIESVSSVVPKTEDPSTMPVYSLLRKTSSEKAKRLGVSSKVLNSSACCLFLGQAQSADPIKEIRQLLKTMLPGLKNLINILSKNFVTTEIVQSQQQQLYKTVPIPLSDAEEAIFSKFMCWTLECCFALKMRCASAATKIEKGSDAFSSHAAVDAKVPAVEPASPTAAPTDSDIREILDLLASVFTAMEPHHLRPVLAANLQKLYDYAVENQVFLSVIQQLLSYPHTAAVALDTMLSFFLAKIYDLSFQTINTSSNTSATGPSGYVTINGFSLLPAQSGDVLIFGSSCLIPPALPIYPNYQAAPSSSASFISSAKSSLRHGADESDKLKTFKGQRASTLLRLFKMVLGSVKSFPENEKTLRPWLKSLITSCLKCAHECRISVNYLFVLRYLFMTISGGKFDQSYSEILPLFPLLLNSFNKLLCRTDHLIVQNVLLELCLTIPSRLASLSQHLPVLLHLLARALCTKGELPNLALRTLEFWVEHLNADCLHTAMTTKQGLMKDILSGICSHLKPAPYPYGMLALRVLGKLGGRNRDMSGMHSPPHCTQLYSAEDFDSGEFKRGENCIFPTARDRKSAVRMLVRKITDGSPRDAKSPAAALDAMDIDGENVSGEAEDGVVYGIGIDNAVFRACELLDRLCTRSTAAECEVPSLLLSFGTVTPSIDSDKRRIFDQTLTHPNAEIQNDDPKEVSVTAAPGASAPPSLDIRKMKTIPDFFQALIPTLNTDDDTLPNVASRFHSIAVDLLKKTDTVDAIAPAMHAVLSQEIREMNHNTVNSQKRNGMKLIISAAFSILGNIVKVEKESSEASVSVSLKPSAGNANHTEVSVDGDTDSTAESNILSRIILAVVATFEDPLLREQARSFLVGVCTHLALYLLSIEKKIAEEAVSSMDINGSVPANPLSQSALCTCVHRAVMAAFEDPRDAMYKAGFWLLNVWVSVTCQVRLGALAPLESFEPDLSSHQFNIDVNNLLIPTEIDMAHFPGVLVDDLIERAINNCYSSRWSTKVAALRVLSELCSRLPSRWCIGREAELVQSVFDMLKQSGLVLMVSASLDASTVLKKLCVSCHGASFVPQRTPTAGADGVSITEPTAVEVEHQPAENVDTKLLRFLILSTFDACMLVRIAAKLYLRQVASARGSSLQELLAPVQTAIKDDIFPHFIDNLASLSIEDKTGIMTGASFLLSISGFTPIDESMFKLLNDGMKVLEDFKEKEIAPPDFAVRHTCPIVPSSVGITEWGDRTLNEYFSLKVLCLPSNIPIMVEFRLHLIHLIETMHTHSSQVMLSEEQSVVDLRMKCFVLLFKSLVTHWDEVKTTAQTAVNAIISSFKNAAGGKSENALPKQVMNECLQPLFGAIQDSRRLSLSTLKSLGVILKIVMHKFYVQFGDKFLSHLKHWLDPEKIMQPPIWAPGEEIVVAATMMDLFHVLPWNAVQPPPTAGPPEVTVTSSPSVLHSFFEQYVQITIRLEAVRSKFRHPFMLDSPFLAPMSKFLYKFPIEGVAFFLDARNIANPGIIRLLLQILKYSSVAAHPFLDKLSSPEAMSLLRRNLLAPALPAAANSSMASAERSPMPAVKTEPLLPATSTDQAPVARPADSTTVGEPAAKRQRTDADTAPISVPLQVVLQSQPPPQSLPQAKPPTPNTAGSNLSVNVPVNSSRTAPPTGANASPSAFMYNANFPSGDHPMLIPNTSGQSNGAASTNSNVNSVLSGPPLLSQNSPKQAIPPNQGQTEGIPSAAGTDEVKGVPTSAVMESIAGPNISVMQTQSSYGQKRPLQDVSAKLPPTVLPPGWTPDSCVNGLKLLYHISCISPKIYESSSDLTSTLRHLWRVLIHRKLNIADDVASSGGQSNINSLEPLVSHPASRVGFRRNVSIHKALRLLTRCLLIVFNFNPDNVDILFDMLPILSTQLVFDVSFFTEFLRLELPSRYSIRVRRNIIRRFLEVCKDPKRALDVKVNGWQLIFIPIFLDAFQNSSGVSPNQIFDTELVETIMQQVLVFGGIVADTPVQRSIGEGSGSVTPIMPTGEGGSQKFIIDDALRIELLKISALLIENFGVHLVSCRKDVIKFAWNNLKSDDVTTKHWGYVLICRFMAAFETPSKIIFQVLFALLRIHQHEARDLIRLALDILIPVLPDRLKPDELLKAMRYTKKIAVEEGHSLPQLIHLWHIIIRHSDIFYPFRSYFIQLMVQSIARLGLTGTCPLDQRQVAVGITDVIVEWEWFRQQKAAATACLKPKASLPHSNLSTENLNVGDSSGATKSPIGEVKSEGGASTARPPIQAPATSSAIEKELDFSLNSSLVPVLANFLVRLGLYGAEGKEPAMYRLSTKCLLIFRKMVQLVPMKNVRMTYFDRYFINTVENMKPRGSSSSSSSLLNKSAIGPNMASDRSLETFLSLLSCGVECVDGPSPLFVNNVVPLKDLILTITSTNEYPKAQKAFRELIVVILKVFPPSQPTAVLSECSFYHKLKDTTDKFLRKFAAMKTDLFRPSPNSTTDKTPTVSGGSGGEENAQRLALMSNLLCLLRLLDAICIQTPEWVDNHGSAFSKLGTKLINDHIEAATSNLRSGLVAMAGSLQEHGQNIETSKVQPTPHMALIAESMRGYPVSASSSNAAAPGGGQPTAAIVLPSLDEPTLILMIVLNIVCRGVSQQHLADQKEVVINLMLAILECSDSILLLGLVIDYLDKWVGRQFSPLSLKSQFDIVARLDNLDRLSEVLTQVLISRLVAMSERVSVTTLDLLLLPPPPPPPPPLASGLALTIPPPKATPPPAVLPRAVDVFGLMSSHDSLRKVSTERAVKVWGPTLYERFLGVFRADLRLHVNRYWPAIIPSVLLKCADVIGCAKSGGHLFSNTACSSLSLTLRVPASHPYKEFMESVLSTDDAGSSNLYEDMMECIGTLSMTSVDACDVWKSMLQILWLGLSPSARGVLANAMCENVAKHQYRQNLYWPSKIYGPISGGDASGSSCAKIVPIITPANVPQSLLRAFLTLEPRPLIPIEFLGAVGAHYATWNDSCEVLESIVFSEKPNALVKQSALRTLLSLYTDIGDQDATRILSRIFSDRVSTDIALSLENYGLHQISQCVIWKGLREYNATRATEKPPPADALSSIELEIWENRWVESAKSLSQWDVLYHHADKLQLSHVAIEAAAMRSDWDAAKRLRYSPSVVACLEMGIPTYKLFDIMQCVLDSRFAEADRLCALTVQMALFRWQLLPPISTGCNAHKNLLHLFHRVIELRESTGMIMEVTKSNTIERGELPDLKGMIETWRERLPDPRDGMYMWDTLLLWRTHVFQLIQHAVRNVQDASQLAALHDTPWTVTKLAHASNKRGLLDSCLLTLSKLDSVSAMDIPDCYNKLREQILVCLKSEKQWNAGLNIINSTNLEFFDWMQKSELFRLKAVFQDMLGLVNDANTTFSQSVQMCLTNGKSWYSWGDFGYKLFLEEPTTENAVSAMVPILKAVECNFDKAKPLLSRVLYLLATEEDILTLGNAFQFCLSTMPEWVWIPHIPQLLEATRRHECNFVKLVLCRLAEKYPQAVYNHLAYFASEPNTTQSASVHDASAADFFRMRSLLSSDVLDVISRSHKSYYHKVSSIFKDIVTGLNNSNLEIATSALISTFNSMVNDLSVRWVSGSKPATQVLTLFARSIQQAFGSAEQSRFFELESMSVTAMRRRIANMEDCFKEAFSWVFIFPTEEGSVTAGLLKSVPDCDQFVDTLCEWIQRLEAFIVSNFDHTPISTLSPALADVFLETNLISRGNGSDNVEEDLEIPGAYQGCWDYENEPSVNLHTKLVRFAPYVRMVKLNDGRYCRRLSMIGSDGVVYHFALLQTSDQEVSSMINFASICDWVNHGLRQSSEAYQRDTEFKQLNLIPVQKGICLLRIQPDSFSLSQALDTYFGRHPIEDKDTGSVTTGYLAVLHNRKLIEERCAATVDLTDQLLSDIKCDVLRKMSDIIPTDALRSQIRQYCPTPDLYCGRTRSFACQLGLHSAMSMFLNGSNDFNAENIIFSCSDDGVLVTGSQLFSKTGLVANKGINFRLTANICGAFSPVLVLGSMASCMGCLLNTLTVERASLEPLLYLILLESERIKNSVADKLAVQARAKWAFDYVEDIAPHTQDISKLVAGVSIFTTPVENTGNETGNETGADEHLHNMPIDVHIMKMTREAADSNSLIDKEICWKPWL